MEMKCRAVVLAAGKGSRMKMDRAKQYLMLGEKPVLVHALEPFQNSSLIQEIILVTGAEEVEYCRKEIVEPYGLHKVVSIIPGGRERYESVWKALCLLESRKKLDGYIFIHDGARPLVTEEIIERAYQDVRKWRACVVGMPVKDTIKVTDTEGRITGSPDRSRLWMAQTPQVFETDLLYHAFERQIREDCTGVTDDAMVVESQTGVSVHMTEGSYTNIKITTPEDLAVAEVFAKKIKKGVDR